MNAAFQTESWDVAALLAIQAAIASADAFTIRHLGKRSASEHHLDAVKLFRQVAEVDGVQEAAKRLERILDEKSWIEYSGRMPRPEDARRLCDHARRFVEFVGRNLK